MATPQPLLGFSRFADSSLLTISRFDTPQLAIFYQS